VVVRVEPEAQVADVQVAERTVTLRGPQLTALRLGYAQHVYSAQGRTVDRTYVVTGGWQTGREATCVAFSRSREATHVYTDYSSLDLDVHDRKAALRELAARSSESQAKVSAVGWIERQGGSTPAATPVAERQSEQRGATLGDEFAKLRAERRGSLARLAAGSDPESVDERTAAERAADERARRQREWDRYEEIERQRDQDGDVIRPERPTAHTPPYR
jgi:hypothetical protein